MSDTDLELNRLSLNTASFMDAFKRFCDKAMGECAERMIWLMQKEIMRIGNGDRVNMRPDAADQVKVVLHDVLDDYIEYDVGINEEELKGMAEELYVRVMVVIHGNMAEGAPLRTKPGQMTYKKFVTNKSKAPEWMSVYNLPIEFSQYDKTKYIVENTMKQMEKYIRDLFDQIDAYVTGEFIGSFIEGG